MSNLLEIVSAQETVNPSQISVSTGNVYEVKISLVEGLKPGDFSQSAKTLDACNLAGLNGVNLVVQGLEKGHGYEVKNMSTSANFSHMNNPNLISETRTSTDQIISYSVTTKEALGLLESVTGSLSHQLAASLRENLADHVSLTALNTSIKAFDSSGNGKTPVVEMGVFFAVKQIAH